MIAEMNLTVKLFIDSDKTLLAIETPYQFYLYEGELAKEMIALLEKLRVDFDEFSEDLAA